MNSKRLERVNDCLKLDDEEEAPQCIDMLFWVRKFTEGLSNSIVMKLNPLWLARTDEITVFFQNARTPERISLNRKPHPLGNEHRTTAFCETNIIFNVKLVDGNDKLKEDMNTVSEDEEEIGSKIVVLYLHMAR